MCVCPLVRKKKKKKRKRINDQSHTRPQSAGTEDQKVQSLSLAWDQSWSVDNGHGLCVVVTTLVMMLLPVMETCEMWVKWKCVLWWPYYTKEEREVREEWKGHWSKGKDRCVFKNPFTQPSRIHFGTQVECTETDLIFSLSLSLSFSLSLICTR